MYVPISTCQEAAEMRGSRDMYVPTESQDAQEKFQKKVFTWPLLSTSRLVYGHRYCGCIPKWVVKWGAPLLLAMLGFFLQNFQLRIGTYFYVHKMVQQDLQMKYTPTNAVNFTDRVVLTSGNRSTDVSYGSLNDPVTGLLFKFTSCDISFLDALAMAFPACFGVLAISMDKPQVWTRIMLAFFVLAIGKGLFAWITVEPDSSGWQSCKARLAASTYSADWYSEHRSLAELLNMNPISRLCADMMWSGHTYMVTLFALGLHECTRLAMRCQPAKYRIAAETIVTLAAFLQQAIEIYYVLRSHFHYTADVVMAVFVTYLLYTNSTIASFTMMWCHKTKQETQKELKKIGLDLDAVANNVWTTDLETHGAISLGCCCCGWSQQFICRREDLVNIMDDVQDATKGLHDPDSKYAMNESVRMIIRNQNGMLDDISIAGPCNALDEGTFNGEDEDESDEDREGC